MHVNIYLCRVSYKFSQYHTSHTPAANVNVQHTDKPNGDTAADAPEYHGRNLPHFKTTKQVATEFLM